MYSWVFLKQTPNWDDVAATMGALAEKKMYDAENNAANLHTQFGYVKNYCSAEKIQQWRQRSISFTDRWIETFKHLQDEDIEFNEIATIIEYVLCLPGTTAPVERVFSSVNKSWTDDKTRLHIDTLKAMLFAKYNIDASCQAFFEMLKTQPALLRKIAQSEKYDKNKETAMEVEPSA